MRVVSWNIQHLELYDQSHSADAALRDTLVLQRPDVLLLQEVDEGKERTGLVSQTELIAGALGTEHHKFQETLLVPREDGQYGIAIASTVPVLEWHTTALRRSPIGRRMTFTFNGTPETFYVNDHPRAAIAAVLANGWTVVNLHLSFMPIAAHLQAAYVLAWARRIAKRSNTRLIIGGDFNFQSSKWLALLGFRETVRGRTFPQWQPTRQIDHLITPWGATDTRRPEIGPISPLSDHRWIAVEVD